MGFNVQVVKAEKYVSPILGINRWFHTHHYGVVVTLDDATRVAILRGVEFFRDQPIFVLNADVMSDVWKLDSVKNNITKSTLGDYIRAAEDSSSSLAAADTMMALD